VNFLWTYRTVRHDGPTAGTGSVVMKLKCQANVKTLKKPRVESVNYEKQTSLWSKTPRDLLERGEVLVPGDGARETCNLLIWVRLVLSLFSSNPVSFAPWNTHTHTHTHTGSLMTVSVQFLSKILFLFMCFPMRGLRTDVQQLIISTLKTNIFPKRGRWRWGETHRDCLLIIISSSPPSSP